VLLVVVIAAVVADAAKGDESTVALGMTTDGIVAD